MTTVTPFTNGKRTHQLKTVQPTGRGRGPKAGLVVKIDRSIIRTVLTPAQILENERFEGATLRVASKLFWEAKNAGEGKDIDRNMAKIARGE